MKESDRRSRFPRLPADTLCVFFQIPTWRYGVVNVWNILLNSLSCRLVGLSGSSKEKCPLNSAGVAELRSPRFKQLLLPCSLSFLESR